MVAMGVVDTAVTTRIKATAFPIALLRHLEGELSGHLA